MQPKILTILILFLSLNVFGQNNSTQDTKTINGFIVPVDLLDPAYPIMKNTGDPVKDAEDFRLALRIYSKNLDRFPVYKNSGDEAKDEAAYDEACKTFFARHPYFPQPINTNNPRLDEQNFDRWYKAYLKFYPEKAKSIIVIEEGGVK